MDPNAQVDQRRQDKERKAPALGQDPQPVRRTSGLTVDDVLAVLNGVRDAHVKLIDIAKERHVGILLGALHQQVQGIDLCISTMEAIKASQSS